MWKRSVKYWSRNCLENLGVSMGLSFVLILFFAGGSIRFWGALQSLCILYPFYLILTGGFCLMIGGVTYFRSYLPMLLSVNATRRRAVLGILFHQVVLLLLLLALSSFIWMVPGGNEAGTEELLLAIAGGMLLTGALGILLGAVSVRWGKIGSLITIILCMLTGGLCGAGVAFFGKEKAGEMVIALMDSSVWWLLILGAVSYVLAGIFALAVTRKIEVRM